MAPKSTARNRTSATGGRPTPGGGRVTPKGGGRPQRRRRPEGGNRAETDAGTDWAAEAERYAGSGRTGSGPSPTWWPVLMFGLLGVGIALIVLDYTGLLPGTPNNWMLIPAVVCIAGGLFAAMSYR